MEPVLKASSENVLQYHTHTPQKVEHKAVRNYGVDLFRLIGAFGVILLHFDFGNLSKESIDSIQIYCRWIVPFFFLASGYFFQKNYYKHGDEAFRKTLLNLFSLTLVVDLIYFPIMIWKKTINHEPYDLFSVFATGSSFHLWFLHSLLLGYLTLWLLLSKKLERLFWPLNILLLVLGILSDSYLAYLNVSVNAGFFRQFLSIPFLIIGFMAAQTKFFEHKTSVKTGIFLLTIGLLIQAAEVYLLNRFAAYRVFGPSFLVGNIIMTMGIFTVALKLKLKKELLSAQFGRKYSLPIYLYHPLINTALFFGWNELQLPETTGFLVLKFLLVISINLMLIKLLEYKFPKAFKFLSGS